LIEKHVLRPFGNDHIDIGQRQVYELFDENNALFTALIESMK
jgi:hypothetical protein